MKAYTMRKDLIVAAVVTGILGGVALSSRAEDNPGALAKALPEVSISLAEGLKLSEREGKPVSGKFELENGALQLSVYTMPLWFPSQQWSLASPPPAVNCRASVMFSSITDSSGQRSDFCRRWPYGDRW
jgi:hypothetical protein